MEKVVPALQSAKAEDIPSFIGVVTYMSDAFFADALNEKMGWIVLREQFLNENICGILLDVLIRQPSRLRKACASTEKGRMRQADPVVAAKEYHAFYIYEFYENALARTTAAHRNARSRRRASISGCSFNTGRRRNRGKISGCRICPLKGSPRDPAANMMYGRHFQKSVHG